MTPYTIHRVVSKAVTGHPVEAYLVQPNEVHSRAIILDNGVTRIGIVIKHGMSPKKLTNNIKGAIEKYYQNNRSVSPVGVN